MSDVGRSAATPAQAPPQTVAQAAAGGKVSAGGSTNAAQTSGGGGRGSTAPSAGASIDGRLFYVNPSTVQWNYRIKMGKEPTLGGKVIQLYGWEMGSLVIGGEFGRDGVNRQHDWFAFLEGIADRQAPSVGSSGMPKSDPVRFRWPQQGWDFWVFIESFIQSGAPTSILNSPDEFNPKYQLTLFVYEDNGNIIKAAGESAVVSHLKRLTAGLGWQQSVFNGPMDFNQADTILGQSGGFIEYGFTLAGITVDDSGAMMGPAIPMPYETITPYTLDPMVSDGQGTSIPTTTSSAAIKPKPVKTGNSRVGL